MKSRSNALALALGTFVALGVAFGGHAQEAEEADEPTPPYETPAWGPGHYGAPCPGYWLYYGYPGMMGAMPGQPGMMAPGYGMPETGAYRFHRIDTDGNGVISAEEAADVRERRFEFIDADGDDALARKEFVSARLRPGSQTALSPEREQMMLEHKGARFDALDADKDGQVSREEFMAEGQRMFARADRDKDGTVTVWEFRANRRF